MKKILTLGFMMIFLLTGCGKFTAQKAIEEFKDDVTSSKAYEIKGSMEISNDEDVFTYKINVAYKKDDYYKVTLTNLTNNHEQVILKNDDGVYVVTPSLNKSFKFQSDWPKNSSQAYLLQSLIDDLERKDGAVLEEKDDYYILKSNVNYPNNPDLINEKIFFDKDMNLKKVEVYNEEGSVRIKVEFDSINYKASFDKEYFDLATIIDEDCCDTDDNGNVEETPDKKESTESTNKLEDIVYPLYIPANTYLTNKDVVEITSGERVILTFAGEKNFILVEETTTASKEFEIIPVYGDPLMFNDVIAALSGNSLHWHSNGVDYYLTAEDLTANELMTIAGSLANTTAVINDK